MTNDAALLTLLARLQAEVTGLQAENTALRQALAEATTKCDPPKQQSAAATRRPR